MEALARLRAKENDIALHTLASRDDLAAVARGHRNVAVLKGWRRTILEESCSTWWKAASRWPSRTISCASFPFSRFAFPLSRQLLVPLGQIGVVAHLDKL